VADITPSSGRTRDCSPENPRPPTTIRPWFWLWRNRSSRACNFTTSAGWRACKGDAAGRGQMIGEYDPTWQYAVAIAENDDPVHAFKVAFVDLTGN